MIAVNEHACPQNHPCPAVSSWPVGAIIQDDIFSAPRIDHESCPDLVRDVREHAAGLGVGAALGVH